MVKTEPNTQHQALWVQADLLLNWTLLATCLMVIGVRVRMVGLAILAMPVFWLVLVLLGLAIGEIQTLRRHGHRWAPATLMPLLMTLVSLIAVWQIHPGVHMWVLVSILLVFTRFAADLALGIGALSLSISLAILILHWQADWRLLAPATMTGILELGILFIHFRASQRARAALDQTRALLAHTVDSMAQGLQVIAPDGQVILHNQQLLELLELPPTCAPRRSILMRFTPTCAAVIQPAPKRPCPCARRTRPAMKRCAPPAEKHWKYAPRHWRTNARYAPTRMSRSMNEPDRPH